MNDMLTQISDGTPHPGVWAVILLLGLGGLLGGATWLVRGAVELAKKMGTTPLVVGLSLVAFGTSAPELGLNVIAAIKGSTELAFGNIVGSNIANIGLVLGLSAFIMPLRVRSRLIKVELPLLIVVTAAVLAMAAYPLLAGGEAGISRRNGVFLIAGFLAFCWMWFRAARRSPEDAAAISEATAAKGEGWAGTCFMVLGGLALLIAGGWATEAAAVNLARQAGVSEAIIGLTIVAVATSLPEVFTSLVACAKGNVDLAVGTVVGSNLFNLLLVLGATSIITPVGVPQDLGWMSLISMLVLTVAMLAVCTTGNRQVSRWEGGGLLVAYTAIIGVSIWVSIVS